MKYKRVLVVCSGNTCRSPMAEAIFQDMVGKEPELQSMGFTAKSTGIYDLGECQATGEAIQVMDEKGLDVRAHRSKHIKDVLVDWADVILAMEHEQKHYIEKYFPHAGEKVHLLTEFAGEEGEVPDPFGCGIEAYRQCVDKLRSLLRVTIENMGSYRYTDE